MKDRIEQLRRSLGQPYLETADGDRILDLIEELARPTEALNEVRKQIAPRPSDPPVAAAEQKWVSVFDRKPDDGVRVLVGAPATELVAGFRDIAHRRGLNWCNDNWHRDVPLEEFPYWRELPAAPDATGPEAGEGKQHGE